MYVSYTPHMDTCKSISYSYPDGRYCHHQRESLKTTGVGGSPLIGAYIPQCDEDGQYVPRQVRVCLDFSS